jgi:hypothetical protein
MSKLTLESQLARFFRRGFKKAHFTTDIYEAFYIHSGRFIAHFDRLTFFKTRFEDPQGFFDTIDILREMQERNKFGQKSDARRLLGAYARDYLARMDILETYLKENSKDLSDLDDRAS